MNYEYIVGGRTHTVRLDRDADRFRVSIDGGDAREVRVTYSQPGTIEFEMSGLRKRLHVARAAQTRYVASGSDVFEFHTAERGSRRKTSDASGAPGGSLEAAMPGQVISVAVREGDEVTKGQTLVVLEAMKMELRVQAPDAGRVQRVLVVEGQVVARGQQLIEVTTS
jgi:biotin carboxyl carrier protein